MAEVVLDRVRKVYPQGGHVAIDDASFSVADGERLVLVGPSGCGKSTLLRMIAGLESISSGETRIGVIRSLILNHTHAMMNPKMATTAALRTAPVDYFAR